MRSACVCVCASALSAQPSTGREAVFRALFDGQPDAHVAIGDGTARVYGKVRYVKGIRGKAAVLGGRRRIVFQAGANVPDKAGTLSLWVRPLNWTPSTENFVFFLALFLPHEKQYSDLLLYKYCEAPRFTAIARNRVSQQNALLNRDIPFWEKDSWHHLVVSWDDKGSRVYLDGAGAGVLRTIEKPAPWKELIVGSVYPSWAYVGKEETAFDELEVYGVAMTDAEVAALYQNTRKACQLPTAARSGPVMVGADTVERKAETQMVREQKRDRNLALAKDGAYVITSSIANYDSSYHDNLIDNDLGTSWKPMRNEWPQYLEVRWDWPRVVNRVGYTVSKGGILRRVSALGMDRLTGDWKHLATFTPDDLDKGVVGFQPFTTDAVRLQVDEVSGEPELDEILVHGPKQPIMGENTPYWDAAYVWYPEPDKVHKGNSPRYFRKTFSLGNTDFQTAFIQARSNDYYRLWINGVEVDNGSTLIHVTDVTHLLRRGANVIAAQTDLKHNPGRWGWGEFLAELSINYLNHSVRIGTGEDWRSHNRKVDGWTEAEFDAADWKDACVYTQPPNGPWGRIAYHSTSIREHAAIRSVRLTPETPAPGSNVRIEVEIDPAVPFGRDYYFVVEIGERATDPRYGGYIAVRQVLDGESVKGKDQPFILSGTIPLPPWTPSGSLPVHLTAHDREQGLGLEFDGVADDIIAHLNIPPRPRRKPPIVSTKIAYTNGQASFLINGEPVTPFFWRLITLSDPHRIGTLSKNSSIDIFQFLIYGGIIDTDPAAWEKTFSALDQKIRNLLGVNPDAGIVVLTDLRPTMQWLVANPGERLLTAFGEPDVVSFASEKYRAESKAFLTYLIKKLKEKQYWDRVVGLMPWSCGMPDSVMGGVGNNTWQSDRGKIT
ncbi:MAG: hypothetical protein KAI66_25345, partial [Lentisphaeria bacterium]|nr:hypothetical protein [Lentisphaeria bacterium]